MIGHLFELAKVQTSQFHFHRANYATDLPLPPFATFLSCSVSVNFFVYQGHPFVHLRDTNVVLIPAFLNHPFPVLVLV